MSRTRATPASVRALRAHAEAPTDPAVHAPRRECYCWWRSWALGRLQVAGSHSPACQPPHAIGRRSAARRSALLPTPRVHRRRGWPHDLLTDLQRPYKPAPVASRAHAHSPPSSTVRHRRRPVWTPFQSPSSLTQAPKLSLVHHKTSPSRLLIKPSRTIAGTRVLAAAAGPPLSSSPLRRSSEPRQPLNTFPRPHGSSPCSMWLSPALTLTAVRVPAGAPPPLAGDLSGQTTAANQSLVSPIDYPHSMFTSPCPTSPSASSPPPSGPGGGIEGILVRILKVLGSAV
jgi:hypothetical protein